MVLPQKGPTQSLDSRSANRGDGLHCRWWSRPQLEKVGTIITYLSFPTTKKSCPSTPLGSFWAITAATEPAVGLVVRTIGTYKQPLCQRRRGLLSTRLENNFAERKFRLRFFLPSSITPHAIFPPCWRPHSGAFPLAVSLCPLFENFPYNLECPYLNNRTYLAHYLFD